MVSRKKFFEMVKGALETWEFEGEEGEIVRQGLAKILHERIDLSANIADGNDFDGVHFQARYVMGEA